MALGSLLLTLALAVPSEVPTTTERLHLGIGNSPAAWVIYGNDGYFQRGGFGRDQLLEVEAGWAHRFGRYFELGAAYVLMTFYPAHGLYMHRVPISARLLWPVSERTELGLTLRLGPLFATNHDGDSDVHMTGGALGPRLDVRHWLSSRLGFSVSAEAWWALADVTGYPGRYLAGHLERTMFGLSLITGSVSMVARL